MGDTKIVLFLYIDFFNPNDVYINQNDSNWPFLFYPRLNHSLNVMFQRVQSCSYRFQRAADFLKSKNVKISPPAVLEDKEKGNYFAKMLGIPVPKMSFDVDFESLDFSSPSVIKPFRSNGSKCVYAIVKEKNYFLDLFQERKFECLSDLRSNIISDMKRNKFALRFIQEEICVDLSGNPQNTVDIKFYCFYGEVKFAMQIDRWHGKKYCAFLKDGSIVNLGKNAPFAEQKPCFDFELFEKAAYISSNIPWPHVRVDFLSHRDGYMFGEFTFRPGNYAEFTNFWDHELGKSFAHADARLLDDFCKGKKFNAYSDTLRNFDL